MSYIGFLDTVTVEELFKECAKMINLNHPNVLTLRGICMDRGSIPYIVLPYMANGILLNYLKKNRTILVQNNSSQVRKVVWYNPIMIQYNCTSHTIHTTK